MIICIAGLTGSGKTTIGDLLSKELNIRHVNRSFKEFAKEGEDLIKFQEEIKDKPKVDRDLDKEIGEEAHKEDSVVSTWLGPWMIKDSSLNVWLSTSVETRAERKARDMHCSVDEARAYLEPKDQENRERWIKLYGIDIEKDRSVFDIDINTDRVKKEEIVAVIAMLSLEKGKKKFR